MSVKAPRSNRLQQHSTSSLQQIQSKPVAIFGFQWISTSCEIGFGDDRFSWDFENRVTSVTLPGGGGTVTFRYDPFGRRIQKSSASGIVNYLYDGANTVTEVDVAGNTLAAYAQGAGIDEPLAMWRAGATSYYEADGLGSVTSLSAGSTLSATYTYDAFGNPTASTGTLTNPFRYTGREWDSETNLYYYRARYYDPASGRFVSEDPIRWFSGTADFYGYVQNDPADLVDPLGLRAAKSATADCIANGLDALFPGVTASVGAPTKEVGGHWNFPIQLQFRSSCAANQFYLAYKTAAPGWPPPARFGSGPAIHLENLGSWSVSGGVYTIGGTAHIDLYNPNGSSNGGGGVGGLAGHVGIDGIVGHLADLLHTNIDPAHCPWPPPQGCPGRQSGSCGDSPSVH